MDWGIGPLNYAPIADKVGVSPIFATGTIANANTFSAWTQIYASTPQPFHALYLALQDADQASTFMYEIGVGAAGSENILLEGLLAVNGPGGGGKAHHVLYPVPTIPAGSRLAFRAKNTTASNNGQLGCIGMRRTGLATFSPRPTTIGVTRSSGTGTTVAAGSTFVQITSSTPCDLNGFFLMLNGASNPGDFGRFIEVAVGPAGSEQTLMNISETGSRGGTLGEGGSYHHVPFPIPAGSRIAVRSRTWFGTQPSSVAAIYGY